MRTLVLAALAVPLLLAPAPAQTKPPADDFTAAGTIRHPPVNEMSGIVRSRTYDDVWWVLNDSGDSARLFAVNAKGDLHMPPFMSEVYYADVPSGGRAPWPGLQIAPARNIDWEDLAIAGDRIYIGEVGNNGNARRDLGVYVVMEPNPRATGKTRPLKFLPIRYPDQKRFPAEEWHFDCEAMFIAGGKLHFLTRHRQAGQIGRGARGTKLYRLDTERTDEENVLTLLDRRDDLALPGAACLSPDGKNLAVLTVIALWVFSEPPEEGKWLSGKARMVMLPRSKTKQAEGVCWDDDETIRVANEQRELFTIPLAKVPPAK